MHIAQLLPDLPKESLRPKIKSVGHVKTNDLDLVYSNCKDLSARGKSVASYIYSLAYAKNSSNIK